jgi:hypothetical protein
MFYIPVFLNTLNQPEEAAKIASVDSGGGR